MKKLLIGLIALGSISAFASFDQVVQCETILRDQNGRVKIDGININEAVKQYSDKGYKVVIEDLKLTSSAGGFGYSHSSARGETSRNEMMTGIVERCAVLKLIK